MRAKEAIRKAPGVFVDLVAGRRSMADIRGALDYQRVLRKTLINLEITNMCNTHCRCCMRDPQVMGVSTRCKMSLDEVAQILDAYRPQDVQAVLFGGGESLLHPDFFTLVEMVQSRFSGVPIGLFTNGIVLAKDRDSVERVAASGIDSVSFSIQGARQATVTSLQPGVSIDGVIAAANYIGGNSAAGLWASYVVQDENVDEMLEFVDLIGPSAFSGVSFIPYNAADFEDGEVDYEGRWQETGIWAKMEAARLRAADYGLQVTPVDGLCSCSPNMDIIRANGAMQICPGNSRLAYHAGNVFAEGVPAVRARKKRELKKAMRSLHSTSASPMCEACSVKGYDLLS